MVLCKTLDRQRRYLPGRSDSGTIQMLYKPANSQARWVCEFFYECTGIYAKFMFFPGGIWYTEEQSVHLTAEFSDGGMDGKVVLRVCQIIFLTLSSRPATVSAPMIFSADC